jgi:hypothetical protein
LAIIIKKWNKSQYRGFLFFWKTNGTIFSPYFWVF